MDRKGDSTMCNAAHTGADAVYLTPATVSYALDKAIMTALQPDLAKAYDVAMSTSNLGVLYAAWNEIMGRLDDSPCDHTRPRSDWRNLFEGYDSLKRGILTRFRQRQRELSPAK